jgi:protein-S-isoprenylcysteine O-methyltransferase Ste14
MDALLFNMLVTLYFWMGSRYEEHRLAALFGQPYREYQMRVPYLLPLRLTRKKGG